VPIQRLGIANPTANSDIAIAEFTEKYLVSVVVANRAATATPITKISIYIVPANANIAAQYAYIAANIELGVGTSFETFRFGVTDGDSLFVRSSTDTTSFSVNGILQDDAALAKNIPEVFTNKTIRGTENTLYLDKGTTAGRSNSVQSGYTRFNTETNELESYTTAGNWKGSQSYTPADGSDWNVTPTTISGALDEIAIRLKALEA